MNIDLDDFERKFGYSVIKDLKVKRQEPLSSAQARDLRGAASDTDWEELVSDQNDLKSDHSLGSRSLSVILSDLQDVASRASFLSFSAELFQDEYDIATNESSKVKVCDIEVENGQVNIYPTR